MLATKILAGYALCYCMYFIMVCITSLNNSNHLFNEKGMLVSRPGNLMGLQFAGILWLGIVPLLWVGPLIPLIMGTAGPGIFFTIVFFMIAIALVWIGFHQSNLLVPATGETDHPENSFYIRYFIVRVAFLIAYELFFRGYFLFFCKNVAGMGAAIAINIFITFLLHRFSSKKMKWASIPFSIVTCIFCLQLNAVWPAILFHTAISLSYEMNYINKIHSLKIAI